MKKIIQYLLQKFIPDVAPHIWGWLLDWLKSRGSTIVLEIANAAFSHVAAAENLTDAETGKPMTGSQKFAWVSTQIGADFKGAARDEIKAGIELALQRLRKLGS